MLRADKFTWVTFPKTMLGAGFFHKVFGTFQNRAKVVNSLPG
jgi:hypothetical protein